MTDTEINIAIAKACPTLFIVVRQTVYWRFDHEKYGQVVDATTDLNAMAEAEATLNGEQKVQYMRCLCFNAQCHNWEHGSPTIDEMRAVCFATARQRAEAFLKVLGLWKD